MLYSFNLAKRFVSDCKHPIPVIREDYFFYYLNLYEEDFLALTKYKKLVKIIEERFDGDSEKFLYEYYQIRDNIINEIMNSEAYEKFNSLDMTKFEIKFRSNISSKDIYNFNNIDKFYISVDLKKANFQVLKKIDKELVLNCETYEDLIGKFTDIDYIKESKYARQVIFGKLNPKRHITIEKYYTYQIYKKIVDIFPSLSDKCVSLSNDEMIFNVEFLLYNDKLKCYSIRRDIERIAQSFGFDVRVEFFGLTAYSLVHKETDKIRNSFFVKEYFATDGKFDLISAPLPYHALMYKLYKDIPLEETDYHFEYEGLDAKLCEEFYLSKAKRLNM